MPALPARRDAGSENFKVMATGSFPSDPRCRRAILVLNRHDFERCAYEPDGARSLLAEDELHVMELPPSSQGSAPVPVQNLVDAGLARPGALLIQSPYESDTYEDASVAAQRFALAKHMFFSRFCMHLGAKEVSVEQIDLRTSMGKTSLDLKAGRSGVSAEIAVEGEELERFRAQMQLHDVFEGGGPDLEAAEALLRRTGLLSDPSMRSLLDMRRDSANQLLTRRLTLSLSSEAKSRLSVAARLKVPAYVKLSADYERVTREQYDYTLVVNVRFAVPDSDGAL